MTDHDNPDPKLLELLSDIVSAQEPSQMTPEREAELHGVLDSLDRHVSFFYGELFRENVGTHVHAFIEHCGLMGEHVNILRDLLARGIDFTHINGHGDTDKALPIKSYRLRYLQKKFDCMFAPFGLRLEARTDMVPVPDHELTADSVYVAITEACNAVIASLQRNKLQPQAILNVAVMLMVRFIDAAGWSQADAIKQHVCDGVDDIMTARAQDMHDEELS